MAGKGFLRLSDWDREDFSALQSAPKAIEQVWCEEYSFHGKGRLFTKHDLSFAKRRDNFAEKESRNPKDDTA